MKWTKDLPTKPGWYWVNNKKENRKVLNPVTFYKGVGGIALGYVWVPLTECMGLDWYGPLEPPGDDNDADNSNT